MPDPIELSDQRLKRLLSVPEIATVNADGKLCVDLTNLAIRAGAPLSDGALQHLALMVQRYIRTISPDATCVLRNTPRLI